GGVSGGALSIVDLVTPHRLARRRSGDRHHAVARGRSGSCLVGCSAPHHRLCAFIARQGKSSPVAWCLSRPRVFCTCSTCLLEDRRIGLSNCACTGRCGGDFDRLLGIPLSIVLLARHGAAWASVDGEFPLKGSSNGHGCAATCRWAH